MIKLKDILTRPHYSRFGIADKVGVNCRFDDGVWIYNTGEGHSFFRCEIPLCRNGDRIELGSYYITSTDDYSKVIEMELSSGPNMTYEMTWQDGDGYVSSGYADNFDSVFW